MQEIVFENSWRTAKCASVVSSYSLLVRETLWRGIQQGVGKERVVEGNGEDRGSFTMGCD